MLKALFKSNAKAMLKAFVKEILKGNIVKDAVVGITLDDDRHIKFFNIEDVKLED